MNSLALSESGGIHFTQGINSNVVVGKIDLSAYMRNQYMYFMDSPSVADFKEHTKSPRAWVNSGATWGPTM